MTHQVMASLQVAVIRSAVRNTAALMLTSTSRLIHHVTMGFASGVPSIHEMHPEGFLDTCVLRAESFLFLLQKRSLEIRRICFEKFLRRLNANFVSMVSPRYCKSAPFNFTMRSSYRRSILASRAHNSLLIRKELRCSVRSSDFHSPFIDRLSELVIVSRYDRQEKRVYSLFSHRVGKVTL